MSQLVEDFAAALKAVDSTRPVAHNARSGALFQAGIGPHSEAATCRLTLEFMKTLHPSDYAGFDVNVPYQTGSRSRCDLASQEWAIEVKMLRLFGDNGKANDNLLMHILSPYPQHRSALTDCTKLVKANPRPRLGILIYAFDAPEWPMELAIDAFEALARTRVGISERFRVDFEGLVHPIHTCGAVFGWEVAGTPPHGQDVDSNGVRLTVAGQGSRPVLGLDFSDNAAVRAATEEEWDRRQLTAGDPEPSESP
jgi:hypothetical protein